jgi:hypothetical protein
MANKTIGELTAGTAPAGSELLHGVQAGNSRKFTVDQIRGWASGVIAALAEGDLLYVNASKEIVRLAKGTAGQMLRQNAALTAPEWVTLPFTKEYTSGEQTITAGSPVTLAHGLGVAPKLITAEIVCKTAELGYSVGDVVGVNIGQNSSSVLDAYGMSVRRDATNVSVLYGVDAGVFIVIRLDNAQAAAITASRWRLIVRAWA